MPTAEPDRLESLALDVTRIAARSAIGQVGGSLGIPGLSAVVASTKTVLTPTLYEPACCLILQGAKELEIGSHRLECRAGQSVIVSHTIPLRSQIIDATVERPYVAVILTLDQDTLVSLDDDSTDPPDDPRLGLDVDTADPATIDGFRRLVDLIGHPRDIDVLAPLVLREIHYRLLSATHAPILRRLRRRGSHARRITAAIEHIRADLARPIVVPDLAREAGMSPSSFHEHFKAVTATTPLQFQKDLRLLEARRLLSDRGINVTETALHVGYASATQFSREYARKFGVTPRDDRSRPVASNA